DGAVQAVEDDAGGPLRRAENPLAVYQRRGGALLAEAGGLVALGADGREDVAAGGEAALLLGRERLERRGRIAGLVRPAQAVFDLLRKVGQFRLGAIRQFR